MPLTIATQREMREMARHGTRQERRGLGSGESSHGRQSLFGSLTKPTNMVIRGYRGAASRDKPSRRRWHPRAAVARRDRDKPYVVVMLPSHKPSPLVNAEQKGQI